MKHLRGYFAGFDSEHRKVEFLSNQALYDLQCFNRECEEKITIHSGPVFFTITYDIEKRIYKITTPLESLRGKIIYKTKRQDYVLKRFEKVIPEEFKFIMTRVRKRLEKIKKHYENQSL